MTQHSKQVVKAKPNPEDHHLQSDHVGKVIVFIVLDQHRTDAALAHAQSFHHRDHHPGNGKVLSYHLEYLVGLADDDHFIQTFQRLYPSV